MLGSGASVTQLHHNVFRVFYSLMKITITQSRFAMAMEYPFCSVLFTSLVTCASEEETLTQSGVHCKLVGKTMMPLERNYNTHMTRARFLCLA